MSNDDTVQISIVVACRNEKDHLRSLLESILSQDLAQTWEVIIADGMSNDGTREILEEYATRVLNLRIIDNPGLIVSAGLNAAIRTARGDVIIRMDGHTCYAPDYCRTCVETLEQTSAENVGGPARTRANGGCGRAVAAAFHSRFSTGGAKFHDINYEGWVDTVPYGCWRKAVLEHIGLFDETLARNQDDELNLRLQRAGGKIWQNPSIVSWYSPRSNLSKLFHQYFQYGYWKVAVIRKHRLPASWRHLVPVVWVILNVALLSALAITAAARSSMLFIDVGVLWLSLAMLYGFATAIATVIAAFREGWAIFPYLPVVFATFHLSYGLGFAAGLVKFISQRDVAASLTTDSAFAKLTR